MKNKNNLWNDKCNEILNKYAKGIIDYDEYCRLMKNEDEKIKSNKNTKDKRY